MLTTIDSQETVDTGMDQPSMVPGAVEAVQAGGGDAPGPQQDTKLKEEAATPDEEDEQDPVASLENDSHNFQRATISLVITLLPHDNHPDGRLTLIGVRSHNLTPHMTTARFNDLLPLPESVSQALAHWERTFSLSLATRKEQRLTKAAEEQAKNRERENKREEERQTRKVKGVQPTAVKAPPVASQQQSVREQEAQESASDGAPPQPGLFE